MIEKANEFETIEPEKAGRSLSAAVIQSMSEMVFLDVLEQPVPNGSAYYENAFSIDILKPLSAKLVLYIPDLLKNRIIKNIYPGDDISITPNVEDDCLLEILNVLTGNFLTEYFGRKVTTKIELPEMYIGDMKNESEPIVSLSFDGEGVTFKVDLMSVRYHY